MLVIKVPIEEIRQAFLDAERSLEQAEPEILQAAADELFAEIEKDFDTKSRGGTGADGTTWDRVPSQPGQPIGVESGEMKRRLTQRRSGDAVEIIYGAPWSRHFDRKRALIPPTCPDAWQKDIDQTAGEVVEKALDPILESDNS